MGCTVSEFMLNATLDSLQVGASLYSENPVFLFVLRPDMIATVGVALRWLLWLPR